MSEEKPEGTLDNVIRIDDARIRDHLGEMVRGTVEEALNAMLDAEADRLCGAARYERSEGRKDTRAGSYERLLHTKAGEVKLKVPKLRRQAFETAIIERYQRRESSAEAALIEMYLAGVSVRRVEDITEALWGTRVSPGTVSNLNKKIYAHIEAWRNRPMEGEHPYLYLDGIVMKRTWAGEVRNVSLLVASAVNSEGYREILGICKGAKEDKAGWSSVLRHLMDRGLSGVQLVISDACRGMADIYGNLGILAAKRGELDEAEQLYRQALEIDEAIGRKEGMASNYANLGILAARRGQRDEARANWPPAKTYHLHLDYDSLRPRRYAYGFQRSVFPFRAS